MSSDKVIIWALTAVGGVAGGMFAETVVLIVEHAWVNAAATFYLGFFAVAIITAVFDLLEQ